MNTDTKDVSTLFFDESIRVDEIVWLASQFNGPCDAMEEFLAECDSIKIAALFGVTPEQVDDDLGDDPDRHSMECFLSRLARLRRDGFLVKAATPVPTTFGADGSFMSYGFGMATTKWFYTETLDAAFAERLVKWKEEFIESKRNAAKKVSKS